MQIVKEFSRLGDVKAFPANVKTAENGAEPKPEGAHFCETQDECAFKGTAFCMGCADNISVKQAKQANPVVAVVGTGVSIVKQELKFEDDLLSRLVREGIVHACVICRAPIGKEWKGVCPSCKAYFGKDKVDTELHGAIERVRAVGKPKPEMNASGVVVEVKPAKKVSNMTPFAGMKVIPKDDFDRLSRLLMDAVIEFDADKGEVSTRKDEFPTCVWRQLDLFCRIYAAVKAVYLDAIDKYDLFDKVCAIESRALEPVIIKIARALQARDDKARLDESANVARIMGERELAADDFIAFHVKADEIVSPDPKVAARKIIDAFGENGGVCWNGHHLNVGAIADAVVRLKEKAKVLKNKAEAEASKRIEVDEDETRQRRLEAAIVFIKDHVGSIGKQPVAELAAELVAEHGQGGRIIFKDQILTPGVLMVAMNRLYKEECSSVAQSKAAKVVEKPAVEVATISENDIDWVAGSALTIMLAEHKNHRPGGKDYREIQSKKMDHVDAFVEEGTVLEVLKRRPEVVSAGFKEDDLRKAIELGHARYHRSCAKFSAAQQYVAIRLQDGNNGPENGQEGAWVEQFIAILADEQHPGIDVENIKALKVGGYDVKVNVVRAAAFSVVALEKAVRTKSGGEKKGLTPEQIKKKKGAKSAAGSALRNTMRGNTNGGKTQQLTNPKKAAKKAKKQAQKKK